MMQVKNAAAALHPFAAGFVFCDVKK